MSLASYRYFLVIATCFAVIHSSRISSPELHVPIGRSVFIRQSDVTVERHANVTSCIVKAITDDVANVLKVGRVEPQVFDCSFKSNTVRYVHSGNPLLTEDTITFVVYQFTENGTTETLVNIRVLVQWKQYDVFIDQPRHQALSVRSSSSLSAAIDEDFLRFRYNFVDGATCMLTYNSAPTSKQSHFPLAGRLIVSSTNDTVDNVTLDCREFLRRNIRYQQVNDIGIDYVPLSVEVDDQSQGQSSATVEESIYIAVRNADVTGSNSPPKIIVNGSTSLRVEQFNSATLGGDLISAVDKETDFRYLMFNVTAIELNGGDDEDVGEDDIGRLVDVHDLARSLQSFSQEQLTNRQIAFYPSSTRPLLADMRVFIRLVAVDSHFAVSDVATLTIVVAPNSAPSSAPRIVYGHRVIVPEGGRQPISSSNLIIIGADSETKRATTQFHVRGGLRHGSLEVDGLRVTSFTGRDLYRPSAVVYRHDGSETTSDRVVLRVTNSGGRHALRVRFPITILPVDDSAPYLTANEPVEVLRGGYVQLTTKNLNSSDRDVSYVDRKRIVYVVTRGQPKAGEIVRRVNPLIGGRTTSKFTQLDVDRGLIYYRHRGGEIPTSDQFEFRLTDDGDGPNKSGKYSLEITISPSDNIPPHELIQLDASTSDDEEVRSVSRRVAVYETDAVVLGRNLLSYEDVENRTDSVQYTVTSEPSLQYTVTSQPYFITSSITVDAGRLVLLSADNHRSLVKSTLSPQPEVEYFRRESVEKATATGDPLTTFSQSDVDSNLIVYVPPRDDIGPIERHIRFFFAVSDSRGGSIMDQQFNVIVMPVDNQLPHLSTTTTSGNSGDDNRDEVAAIEVEDGASTRLDADKVIIYDPDTDLDKLIIAVEDLPTYGRLTKDGKEMIIAQTFQPIELNSSDIRYVHDGASASRDKFSLSVFDGLHKVINEFVVSVRPPASVPPLSFLSSLVGKVEVEEGGEVALTIQQLATTGGPRNDDQQTFHVLKSPEFGELRLDVPVTVTPTPQSDGAPQNAAPRAVTSVTTTVVYRFTQGDIKRGAVRYVHTGGEVGHDPVVDVLTLTVTESDKPLRMQPSNPVPLRDIEVVINPRDNSAPQLVVGGPIRVTAGQRAVTITPDVITARDVDSPEDSLAFVVAQTPMWGFLERSKTPSGSAATRSGRSQTSRRVTTFSLADLREGTVQYVPSNLAKGGGPPSDSFTLYVTDGHNRSPPTQIEVSVTSILSATDGRLPEFRVVDTLTVDEGGDREFDVQLADRTLSRIVLGGSSSNGLASVGGGQLVLSVAVAPVHGKLVLVDRPGADGRVRQTDMHEMTLVQPSVQLIYRHDGTESRDDGFTLSLVDAASNNAAFRKSVTVVIRAVNDEPPVLVKNVATSVDFGGTLTIVNGALKATDVDNFADEVFFVVASRPKRGDLELLRSDPRRNRDTVVDPIVSTSIDSTAWDTLEIGSNFTQLAIDEKRLRYVHTTCIGEMAPIDEFTFIVTDGVRTLPPESFVIDISRANARRMLVVSREMLVRDGETRVIAADQLGADDGAGRPAELTFTVTQPPQHGTLGLAGLSGSPLASFTQSDLRAQRVLYKHGGGGRHQVVGGGGLTKDSFRFTVTSATRPYLGPVVGQFRINVESSERRLPTLDANVPLTVVEGDTSTLTASNLRVSQSGTPSSNLTFIVVERPQRGELLVGGIPVARSFTQADIDSSAVEYHSEAVDETMTDYFLFAVADGRHDGYLVNGTAHRKPAFFNILIQPASKDPPRLVRSRPPTSMRALSAGRKGFIIGNEQLSSMRAQPGGRTSDMWYVLKDTCCRFGYLEHVKTGRPIRRKFSQKDVDDGNVAFVLNGGDSEQERRPATGFATNDSFLFRLQDQHNNYVDDQRYAVEWSVISLEKSQYSVCESARRLDVIIRRHGALNNHVTVNVRAKPLSARQRFDFNENSAGLVEFLPGISRLTWTIDIVQDNLDSEVDEKFKILLRNPTNAVFGDVNKAVVLILNSVNGQCRSDSSLSSSNKQRGGDPDRRSDYDDEDDEEFNGFDESACESQPSKSEHSMAAYSQTQPVNYSTRFSVDQSYDDHLDSFDSFGVDRDDADDNNIKRQRKSGTGVDADDNDDVDGRYYDEEYDTRSRQLEDVDLLPPPQDEMTSGRLLGDGWVDNDDDTGRRDRGRQVGRREHPLNKHRKGKKNDRKSTSSLATSRGTWQSTLDDNRRERKQQQQQQRAKITTTTVKPTANAFVPQECTPDTSGLLYFDMLSSKMYRCSGREWQEWGWGTAGGDGFQYTALLKDAAVSSTSTVAQLDNDDEELEEDRQASKNEDDDDDDDEDDGNIEATTPATERNARKRKMKCKPGWSQYEANCYRFYDVKKSRVAADQSCKDDGATLTNVRSKAHLMWLWKQLAGQKNFWTGLSDPLQSGVWQYDNSGLPAEYFNWRRNYPTPGTRRTPAAVTRGRTTRVGSRENCVQVGKRAEWVNKACGPKPKARFICVANAPTSVPDRTSASKRNERQLRNG